MRKENEEKKDRFQVNKHPLPSPIIIIIIIIITFQESSYFSKLGSISAPTEDGVDDITKYFSICFTFSHCPSLVSHPWCQTYPSLAKIVPIHPAAHNEGHRRNASCHVHSFFRADCTFSKQQSSKLRKMKCTSLRDPLPPSRRPPSKPPKSPHTRQSPTPAARVPSPFSPPLPRPLRHPRAAPQHH